MRCANEVGLEVEVERLAGLYSWITDDEVIFVFRCQVIGGALANTDESDDARYFALDALDALPANTFHEHIRRVGDVALDYPHTVLRIPTGPSGRGQADQQRSGGA